MTKLIPLSALIRRASKIAEQMFDKQGEIEMFWVVENAAGEQQKVRTPMIFPPDVPAPDYKDDVADALRDLFRERDIVRYVHVSEAWTVDDLLRLTSDLSDDEGTVFVTSVPRAPFQILGRRGPDGKLYAGSMVRAPAGEMITAETINAGAEEWTEIVTGPEAEEIIAAVELDKGWLQNGGGTLSTHPRRRELVAFHAEDGCEALCARREIIRPAGGNAYLGKLGPIERHDRVEGRFVGLLPTAGVAS
jgi:hypothetical protein